MNASTHGRATLVALVLSLVVLGAPAAAQVSTLFGLDNGMAGAPPAPRLHQFDDSCQRISACFPPAILGPIPSPMGGVAHGECSDTLWVTDGVRLEQVDRNCVNLYRCPTGAAAGAEWKGLAIDEDRGVLVYTDGSLIVRMPIPTTCPLPPATSRCRVPPAFAAPITGVEIDPIDGCYWICDSRGNYGKVCDDPASGVCRVVSFHRVACPTGIGPTFPLQGITFDPCRIMPGMNARGVVTITDSSGTIFAMDRFGNPQACCSYGGALGPRGHLVGLARDPIKPCFLGRGCTGPNCPRCIPHIGHRGDSVIPTTCFDVTLENAPGGSRAYLLADFGTVAVPIACGTLNVLPSIVIGPAATGGTAGACDGTASVNLPIPRDPTICNARLCFQWVIFCSPSFDLALSDAMCVILN